LHCAVAAGLIVKTMNDEQRQALRAVARSATPADLSILEAALSALSPERPTLLTTVAGSNNDRLWSAMVALGWMDAAEPLEVPVHSKVYLVNPAAQEEIRGFLADNARSEAMTAIINEFRANIPPRLIDAVRSADGTPADLAILLASIVEGTMRRAIKRELHDEFLAEVAKVAEGMRST
jgi:hypothetical protein